MENNKFTMSDYLINPAGIGNATNNSRIIKEEYTRIYEEVKSRIGFKYYNYKNKAVIAIISIPSSSDPDLKYEVVIECQLPELQGMSLIDLRNRPIKVFSNSPSFIFTYANTFYTEGKYIPWLKDKLPREVFAKKPVTRNPNQQISFEKSLYLAFLYLNEKCKTTKLYRSELSIVTNLDEVKFWIKKYDDIERLRNTKKEKEAKKKKTQEKEKNESIPKKISNTIKGIRKPKPLKSMTNHGVKGTKKPKSGTK